MIVDRFGRQFQNLRVSLTAACNYACTYCVPNGKKLQPAEAELDAEQLLRAVRLLVDGAGIEKLRITGGEPLLSKKFETFVRGVSELELKDTAITTNGQLLPKYMPLLEEIGFKRLNISLDTLDAKKFRSIARSGDLETVLRGIEMACDVGMKVKINMVPLKTANFDQVLPLLDYCLDRGIELRFIELMNMGHLKLSDQYERDFVSLDMLLATIRSKYEVEPITAAYDSTSLRYEVVGRGIFGVIANESEPFCRSCSRLRLSSNGHLYGCLSNTKNYDLSPLLTKPYPLALNELQGVLTSALGDKQSIAFTGETTVMKFIGG
ncbi:MAG: GTP 3',8-cyclase MoaA [Gammaproteobacteria bacterium]|nr:GTP 3',8-cyclase MoaA [Gammaproteobacteria bacterium]